MNATQRMARAGRAQANGHTDLAAEDARQGVSTGYMRRVLTVSLALAALAMAIVWLAFFRSMPPAPHPTANTTPTALTPDTHPAPGAATPGQRSMNGAIR